MATLRTVYVDPDVSGGAGNGTSWANAYSSLNAAEQAQDDTGDIVTSNEYVEFHCGHNGASQTTADTTAVNIDGWTTGASNYIALLTETADRHNGTYQTTKYRLTLSTTNPILIITEPYVRVDGLQFKNTANGGATAGNCIQLGSVSTSDLRVSNSLLLTHNATAYYDGQNATKTSIWNCVFYDDATGVYGIRFYNAAGSANNVYSCTISGYDTGAIYKYGTTTVKNCLFYDNAVDVANGPATDTYCATSNDNTKGLSAAGTGNRFSQTFTFVAAPTNFALAAADAGAREYGTDTSGSSAPLNFTTDIVGTTRS